MSAVREAWTDERLDDLAHRMDGGFERVDRDIRDLRAEMNSRFDAVNGRFDAMQRMMLAGFVSILAALIATQL
jgi:thiosulfate reductase cytochrome b subunit